MKCIQCKEEFEGQRSTAKFCSDKCRKQYNRGVSVTKKEANVTVKPLSVTKEEVSVSQDVTVKNCAECEKKDLVIAELKSLLEVKRFSKKRSHIDLSDSPFSKARQVRRQGFD